MKKKFTANFVKILALGFVLTVFTSAVGFGGLYADHWAQKELNKWKEGGLLTGDADGSLREDDSITRAEFMALINRMQGFKEKSTEVDSFKDVKKDDWYYETVAIALKAGYIKGLGQDKMDPTGMITREQAMAILERISGVSKNSEAYKLAGDNAEISNWAKEAVSTCIAQGFIVGDKGNVKPLVKITRAEAVVMLDRKLTDTRMFSFSGDYNLSGQQVKNVVILGDGIKISNAKVEESLAVKEGLQAKLELNDVEVNTLEAGKAEVSLKGNSKVSKAILKGGSKLNNETKKADAVKEVEIDESAQGQKVELNGDFERIVNNAKDLNLELKGKVKTLTLKKDAEISGNAKIEDLKLENKSKLSVQDKNGKKKVIDKDTKNISVETKPEGKKDNSSNVGSSDSGSGGSSGGDSGSNPVPSTPKADALTVTVNPVASEINKGKVSVSEALTAGNKYVVVKDSKVEVIAANVDKDSVINGDALDNLDTALEDLRVGKWVVVYEVKIDGGKNKVQKVGSVKLTGENINAEKADKIDSQSITADKGTVANSTKLTITGLDTNNSYIIKKNLTENDAKTDNIFKGQMVDGGEAYISGDNITDVEANKYIMVFEVNAEKEVQKVGSIKN